MCLITNLASLLPFHLIHDEFRIQVPQYPQPNGVKGKHPTFGEG